MIDMFMLKGMPFRGLCMTYNFSTISVDGEEVIWPMCAVWTTSPRSLHCVPIETLIQVIALYSQCLNLESTQLTFSSYPDS